MGAKGKPGMLKAANKMSSRNPKDMQAQMAQMARMMPPQMLKQMGGVGALQVVVNLPFYLLAHLNCGFCCRIMASYKRILLFSKFFHQIYARNALLDGPVRSH